MISSGWGRALLAVSLGFLASGCGRGDPTGPAPHETEVHRLFPAQLDPGLSYEERSLLVDDVLQGVSYQIQAQPGSFFDQIFGGTDNQGVLKFLNERVHYLLPQDTNIEAKLNLVRTHDSVQPLPQSASGSTIYAIALNLGTALWLQSLEFQPQTLTMKIGDQNVPIDSTRVGIVQLQGGYTARVNGNYAFPGVVRFSALVHEARHSDCTGGLSRSDAAAIVAGSHPESHACGHTHVTCPRGHSYAGAPACDAEPWGAYAVQAVHAAAIYSTCTNCSDADKRYADAIAVDSLSRLLLDPMALSQGAYGSPDMSSSSAIQDHADASAAGS